MPAPIEVNAIGWYQVHNLIRGRIPFLVFQIGCDLKPFFGPMEIVHLRTWAVDLPSETTTEQALSLIQSELKERDLPKEAPMLVICPKGDKSRSICESLFSQDYQNAVFVSGGFEQLAKDRSIEI